MSATNKQHDNSPGGMRWIGVTDATALQRVALKYILDAAATAIEQRGRFLVVLAGGDTPRRLYRSLRDAETDWSRWRIYFGDERCLPADDTKRNSRMVADAWLDHVAIPPDQIYVPPTERGAEAAAQAYVKILRDVGDFDLVLLGLGDDGHTASLFPGHDWGTAQDAPDAIAVRDAPKPPPQRFSLTAARLSRARAVLFLIEGESKHEAVTQWRKGADIPARAIRPDAGVDVLIQSMLLPAG